MYTRLLQQNEIINVFGELIQLKYLKEYQKQIFRSQILNTILHVLHELFKAHMSLLNQRYHKNVKQNYCIYSKMIKRKFNLLLT